MSARQAIPGLVRRIVEDGDWQAAPLILADALEEIGECRAARLLRVRQKRLANQLADDDGLVFMPPHIYGSFAITPHDVKRWRERSIDVFRLYVARKFPDSESMYLDSLAGWLPALSSTESRILPALSGVQPS